MPWTPPQSRSQRQWNPETAGPLSRWALRHIWGKPAGLLLVGGYTLLVFAVLFAGISLYLWSDENALQSDREFFPFITAFFALLGLLSLLIGYLVRRVVRRRQRNAPPLPEAPWPWAGPADPARAQHNSTRSQG